MLNLNETDWWRLIESIHRGNCVLLCGPDVELNPAEPQGGPLASKLARTLAKSLPLPVNIPHESDDLAHVAQLRYNERENRFDLEFEVKEFYKPLDELTSDFHRDLARLPFTLCLTTSPTHFLSNAFQAVGKIPILEFYHFRKSRLARLSETDSQRPIVYHLYGDLSALDSLVLTETDLLEFLVNIVRGAPPLPAYIQGQLADKQTSFLFLGFGFQRWYTRVLLHALQTYHHHHSSIAVEAESFFNNPDTRDAALFFEKEHKIAFRQHSWVQFATELRRRHEELGPAPTPRKLLPDGPMVFLCYDTRDRERVRKVEEQLQTLGIGTWRDQQDLRGGDEWDRRIEQVVRKQVDYMLVLQTPNMLHRSESYIHKEIKEALARQDLFDQDQRFLIPAILEPNAGLERLKYLQSADLTSDEGLRRLAKEIRDDWGRRRSRSMENA